MSSLSRRLATTIYRQAANVSARMLIHHPIVESVLLHRSVATGEVDFGRSDIDMMMVINEKMAGDGANLASLYRTLRRARMINPALNEIDMLDPASLVTHMLRDSFLASVERRTLKLLRGKPVEIPVVPVHPDHAISRFVVWIEWFFAIALRQRDRRNLRKVALEAWNTYALADGLIVEPGLSRNEMAARAVQLEPGLDLERLEEPAYSARFVFGLAERLHRSRRPRLGELPGPFLFEAATPPLGQPRKFVVLPRFDTPLPPEVFQENAFPCTPEVLDLYLHYMNAFFYWIRPRELAELGIQAPSVAGFVRSCLSYGHNRFLLVPGFGLRAVPEQAARLAQIGHAVEWAARNQLPPPFKQQAIQKMSGAAPSILQYYRDHYGSLRRESQRIEERALAISGAALSS